MSKRKAKAPTTKNIVDGDTLVQLASSEQMYTVQVSFHILKILQLMQTSQKFRNGLDKLLKTL